MNSESKFYTSSSDVSVGILGALIFFSKIPCQSNPENQGCFFISSAPVEPNLFSGSFKNNPYNKSTILGDK